MLAHVPSFGRNPRGSPDFLAYPVPKACMHVLGTRVPRRLGVARSASSPKAALALGCSLTPGLRISFGRVTCMARAASVPGLWALGFLLLACVGGRVRVAVGRGFCFHLPVVAGVLGGCVWARFVVLSLFCRLFVVFVVGLWCRPAFGTCVVSCAFPLPPAAVWACVLGPGLGCAPPFLAGLSGCVFFFFLLFVFFFFPGCLVSPSRASWSLPPSRFILAGLLAFFFFFFLLVSVPLFPLGRCSWLGVAGFCWVVPLCLFGGPVFGAFWGGVLASFCVFGGRFGGCGLFSRGPPFPAPFFFFFWGGGGGGGGGRPRCFSLCLPSAGACSVAGVWCGWSLATPGGGSCVLLPATPGWVSLPLVVGGPRHSWLGSVGGGGVWCVVCGGGLLVGFWLVCGVVGPSPLLAEVPVCYSPPLLAGFRCRWWCGVCGVWCVAVVCRWGCGWCVLWLVPRHSWRRSLCATPRHSWLGFAGGGGVWCVVCGVWRWCVVGVVVGVWCGWSLATPGGGPCVLLPATPGWVSLPVAVGVPRHSWLGSAGGGGVWCVVCGVWRWCVVGVVVGVWCGWSLATPGGGPCVLLPATPGWVSLPLVVGGPRHSWLGSVGGGGVWCVVCGGGLLVGLWLVCGVVGPSPLLAEVPVCYSPPLLAGFRWRRWCVVCGVWCVAVVCRWGCGWCVVWLVPRHSWRRSLCATPRHSWLGFAGGGGVWCVVCGVWRWCVVGVVVGVWCGWSLATPGGGPCVLLPATPGWVSLPVAVGVPRHSWLGSAGGGGVWCVVCGVWRWCVVGVVVGVWCGWSLATPGGGPCVLLPATPGWVSLPLVVGGPRHSWLGSVGGGGVWCVVCGVWWWCVVGLVVGVWRWCVVGVVVGVWCGWSLATPGGGPCVLLPATPGWVSLPLVVGGPRHSWLGSVGGGGVWCVVCGVLFGLWLVCGGGVLLGLWLVCGVVGPSPLLAEVPVCYSPPLLAGFRCRWWWAVPATPGRGPLAAVVCVLCLAGSDGPASRARSGAPHLFLWPLCLSALLGPLRVGVAPLSFAAVAVPRWLGFVVCGLAVAWHLFVCRGSLRVVRALRVCGTRQPSLLGTCPCALVVAGGVPLWRASWPRVVRRASSGPVALGAPVGFPDAVVPFPTPGACAPGFTGRLRGARGGRPRTGLIVPAAGPRRGRGAGLVPRRTRSGPRDGVVPGGSLRRRSWAACAAVVGVCGPGH